MYSNAILGSFRPMPEQLAGSKLMSSPEGRVAGRYRRFSRASVSLTAVSGTDSSGGAKTAMSQSWQILPLAAVLAVLGTLLLVPGGITQPRNALAEINCEATKGTIQVQIQDLNSSSVVDQAGISVRITPDPLGGGGSRIYVDNGTNDDNTTVGVIRENSASISTGEDYTIALLDFPANYSCDILAGGSED